MEDNYSAENHQEQYSASVKQTASKWGLILGVVSIALFVIILFTGMAGNQLASWLTYIPTIVIVVLAHNEFKKDNHGFMTYGQGVGLGTLLVLIGSLLNTAFFYVYIKFFDNSFMDILKEKQLEEMQKQGLSDEQIDQAIAMSENFMTPEIISLFGLLGAVFFGFILSLIISAFTKKSENY